MKTTAENENESRGVYSKAIRQTFPDLKNANYNDDAFQAALAMVKRAYAKFLNPSDEEPPEKLLKNTFRMPGKSGPKVRAPEIREGLYEWLVDVRSAVKARIPRAVLRAKGAEIQTNWLVENPEAAVGYVQVKNKKNFKV